MIRCSVLLISNKPKADLIFMPYNYLLDMNVRMVMETKLSNTIVIFDEV
ncbi:MAG: hypothetical protein EOP84_28855 [Verrucomicrobiaceae bacterium]|nr:MAG: hypothetical protein EOP84_28855 [Verrucomicrobiaceae bacterium]